MANHNNNVATFYLLLLLPLLQLSLAFKIEEMPQASHEFAVPSTAATLTPTYRTSKPEPKQPTKRVPPHLQDIRQGYVDDDAGDVIRIIEPPQHFQELKRLQQHGAGKRLPSAVVWEQPRKLSINRPPSRPKNSASLDLLTQETRLSARTPPQLNNLQLPMEILASVRKTERLLQRQRPKLPLMRQRHITRQMHTLISQKALEQQLYQQGQEHRLRAALMKEHKRSKRIRRELRPQQAAATKSKKRKSLLGSYDVQQGLKLVAHIGELLKNATLFLPDELEPNAVEILEQKGKPQQPTSVLASEVQQPCGSKAANCNRSTAQQQQQQQKQQQQQQQQQQQRQSDRRRQQLFKQAHGTPTTTANPRNFRHEATTITALNATATASAATSASPRRWHGKPLASRLANARKSPASIANTRNHNQLPQRRSDKQAPSPSGRKLQHYGDESAALTRASAELLYDDVMANIRNLWQEHDAAAATAAAPEFIAPAQVVNNSDYRALNVYLKELDDISKKLPTVAPITTLHSNGSAVEQSTSKFSLNTEEFERATPTPSWYLINKDGKIYETRLDSETKPNAALFHRFPDMPKSDGQPLDEGTMNDWMNVK